ncbi:hypothetical protein Acr_08g0018130 [Actinidia rufa]|uniref:Uncharacterized protein n=1 Tax=Actinidia rufa TaxID=165716 RepID=A0A7J0F672_9ERIC|nr:hypothetical protein Acr_08g0018130 [Actinidia rufa]
MAQVNYANVHSFLLEGNTPYYWAMGFVIGIATVIGGLYFTKVGKKHLRRVAIPAAAIEMRTDENVELVIQAPQIGVAIPTAAIEMGRYENVELEIQAPQIGVAIENEESDDVSFNPV